MRFEDEALLRRAMEADPTDARAPYYLGNLLFDNQPTQAIVARQQARDLDKDFSPVHRNLAFGYAQAEQSISKAVSSMEKAVELNPNDAHAHNNLASVLAAQGELARAAEHYRSALAIDPDYAAARARLEQVRDELRRREK